MCRTVHVVHGSINYSLTGIPCTILAGDPFVRYANAPITLRFILETLHGFMEASLDWRGGDGPEVVVKE